MKNKSMRGVHAISLSDEDSEWLKNHTISRQALSDSFHLIERGELTFKKAGEMAGITPSRASQIFSKRNSSQGGGIRGALATLLNAGVLRVHLEDGNAEA